MGVSRSLLVPETTLFLLLVFRLQAGGAGGDRGGSKRWRQRAASTQAADRMSGTRLWEEGWGRLWSREVGSPRCSPAVASSPEQLRQHPPQPRQSGCGRGLGVGEGRGVTEAVLWEAEFCRAASAPPRPHSPRFHDHFLQLSEGASKASRPMGGMSRQISEPSLGSASWHLQPLEKLSATEWSR